MTDVINLVLPEGFAVGDKKPFRSVLRDPREAIVLLLHSG